MRLGIYGWETWEAQQGRRRGQHRVIFGRRRSRVWVEDTREVEDPADRWAEAAARQGGRSGERCGYARLTCWAAAAGTGPTAEGKDQVGERATIWASEGREQVGRGGEVGCSGQKLRKGEEENKIPFLFSNPFSNHFKSI